MIMINDFIKLEDAKITERLDMVAKGEISYEYIISKMTNIGNGVTKIEDRFLLTNDLSELDKDYNFDTLPISDSDIYYKHEYLDDRFPINYLDLENALNSGRYEYEKDSKGRLISILDKKNNISLFSTFDFNGNLISSILRFPDKEFRSIYLYDEKNRLIISSGNSYNKHNYEHFYYINNKTINKSSWVYSGAINSKRMSNYNNIEFDEYEKTSISGTFKDTIFTKWDDNFKHPLYKIAVRDDFKNHTTIIHDIAEYEYKDNITFVKRKVLNIIDK